MQSQHYLTIYDRGECVACHNIYSASDAIPVFIKCIRSFRTRAVIECETASKLTTIGTIHIGRSGRVQLRPAYNGRTISV